MDKQNFPGNTTGFAVTAARQVCGPETLRENFLFILSSVKRATEKENQYFRISCPLFEVQPFLTDKNLPTNHHVIIK